MNDYFDLKIPDYIFEKLKTIYPYINEDVTYKDVIDKIESYNYTVTISCIDIGLYMGVITKNKKIGNDWIIAVDSGFTKISVLNEIIDQFFIKELLRQK